MKTSHDYQPATQLLNEWAQKFSGTQDGVDGNDQPAEKSRWTKWKLTDGNDVHSVSYCRVEKSESTLLGRLADRLNYWSGNARCAAKNEIIEALRQQGIEITDDIKKALPDRWKLGNTNLLESGIKAALIENEKAATAKREVRLKDYRQSELAEPFRQYIWGVVNYEVTSAGDPMTEKFKPIEKEITEKIAQILEPQLNIFIDSLLTSLSRQEPPVSTQIIEECTQTQLEKFLFEVFSSSEVKAIEDQISSTYEIVDSELSGLNRKFKRTDTMPRLNPRMSGKLIEKVIKQRTANILDQRKMTDLIPFLTKISRSLDPNECMNFLQTISETLTRQLKHIKTKQATQKSSVIS